MPINVADSTLNILCAAQIFQLVEVAGASVHDAEFFIERRAEDYAALAQNNFAQSRERAARRTVSTNFFIGINRRENFRELGRESLNEIECGTNLVAMPAFDAKLGIDFRVGKAFVVANHLNRGTRTNVGARFATRAFGVIGGNHFLNLHPRSPPIFPFPTARQAKFLCQKCHLPKALLAPRRIPTFPPLKIRRV